MDVIRNRNRLLLSVLVFLLVLAACGQPTATSDSSTEAAVEPMEPSAPDAATPLAEEPVGQPATQPAVRKTPAPTRAPAPAPAEPEPQYVVVDIPAGTELEVELLDALSSGTNQVGDPVRGQLVYDLVADGVLVAPAGAQLFGSVTEVVPLKKFGGQPSITMAFESIESEDGTPLPVLASVKQAGKKQAGRDAAKIGGAAAAGAVIGHQVDSDKGKEIGALIGGAIGTAVAAKTGKEVELAAGTAIVVVLEYDMEVRVES
jgi:hypothetical protein